MGKSRTHLGMMACLAATLALPAMAQQQADPVEPAVVVPYAATSDVASAPNESRPAAPAVDAPIDFESGSKESVETRLLEVESPRWLGGVESDLLSVEPFELTPPPRNPGLAAR